MDRNRHRLNHLAVAEIPHRTAGEEPPAARRNVVRSAVLGPKAERFEPSGLEIVAAGLRTSARRNQPRRRCRQMPPRHETRECRTIVRLHHVRRTVTAANPQRLAGLGIDRVHEDAHEGPNPGREVKPPVEEHGTAAHRPGGDESLVADDAAIGGTSAHAPGARFRRRRPRNTDTRHPSRNTGAPIGNRRQPHRPLGKEPPNRGSRRQIVSRHAVVDRRGNEKPVVRGNGAIGLVKSKRRLTLGPGRLRRRKMPNPPRLQIRR